LPKKGALYLLVDSRVTHYGRTRGRSRGRQNYIVKEKIARSPRFELGLGQDLPTGFLGACKIAKNWHTSGHNGSPIALGGAENITTWWWHWRLASRESRVEGQIWTGPVTPRNATERRLLTTRKLLKTLRIESNRSPHSGRRRVHPPASCGVMDVTEILGIGPAARYLG